MKTSSIITILGFSIIIFYSISQILLFFGVSQSTYGIYILFYAFMVLSIIVLPHNYPSV